MSLLEDEKWEIAYASSAHDLVQDFYIPALSCAVRYDRLTGFFSARSLTLAARGVERLVQNEGHMRLVVGCTLEEREVQAIERGARLREEVLATRMPTEELQPFDAASRNAFELLAWMIAHGHLDIRVAVPCDEKRRPQASNGLFHPKAGTIEDKTGQRIAFSGSLNETEPGWSLNWERFDCFTGWHDRARVDRIESEFSLIWNDKDPNVCVVDVPEAQRQQLLQFLPKEDRPALLRKGRSRGERDAAPATPDPAPATTASFEEERTKVWRLIREAPTLPAEQGGERVGEATSAVSPWPHQIRAFERMYRNWPPRLLIADEVGLGKTVQGGMLVRQAWLAGKAKRILVLAPKSLLTQWQTELRQKFNLAWPIYDGAKLVWADTPARRGGEERSVARTEWHREPFVLASSQLLRRTDRATELLDGEPWDLVVLDEAHHARVGSPGSPTERGPNRLLRLMRSLREKTQALILLTATPMQVHPVEVWDLLDLLGMPPTWSREAFVNFFKDVAGQNPSHEAMERMSGLFRACEETFGPISEAGLAQRLNVSSFRLGTILRALRDKAATPRRQFSAEDRALARRLLKANTPIRALISRHTRTLLREYWRQGRVTTRIATRDVRDEFLNLSPEERAVHDAMQRYIETTWRRAAKESGQRRSAVGFMLTTYAKRLASSFYALRKTLEEHKRGLVDLRKLQAELDLDARDLGEDRDSDDDIDEANRIAREAPQVAEVDHILNLIAKLGPDTKSAQLSAEIQRLRGEGYDQVIVFTQFTDTMDALRERLAGDGLRVMCFSGRGGERRSTDGSWTVLGREDLKRRFKNGEGDVLLCTDAAAEGLNFQYVGALINADAPWNPLKVEQRIGRIDRLGQRYERIHVINLHYADTVEASVYNALRTRIGLFESTVGSLQPILSRLPSIIEQAVIADPSASGGEVAAQIDDQIAEIRREAFELDDAIAADFDERERPNAALDLTYLGDVLAQRRLLPPGFDSKALPPKQYAVTRPGEAAVRVTVDAVHFEEHSDSVELWSPGSPTFPAGPDG